MLSNLCLILFFLIYGISHFVTFPAADVVLAILAIIIGIALIAHS